MRDFMKNLLICMLGALTVSIISAGCSSGGKTPELDPTKFENMPKRVTKKTLPKISTDECELKIPYDITVNAGTSLDLNIQLAYYGRKTLEIKEWYMFDQYNFDVWYRKLETGKISNDKKLPFKLYKVKPPKGSDVNRSGLILHRDNRAVLTVTLPFTGELNPGEKALFEVYISTNLRTFKLRSNRMLVRTR